MNLVLDIDIIDRVFLHKERDPHAVGSYLLNWALNVSWIFIHLGDIPREFDDRLKESKQYRTWRIALRHKRSNYGMSHTPIRDMPMAMRSFILDSYPFTPPRDLLCSNLEFAYRLGNPTRLISEHLNGDPYWCWIEDRSLVVVDIQELVQSGFNVHISSLLDAYTELETLHSLKF